MATNTFRYCPHCATPLVLEMRFDAERPTCPACGFVQFMDPKVAVIALVIHAGKVLLVQRAIEPAKGRWALPGGFMDAGEMPRTALQRELNEEVGMTVQVDDLIQIYPMETIEGERIGIVLAFQACPKGSVNLSAGTDDVQAAGWFAPEAIPRELAFESTVTLINAWKASLTK